MFYGHSNPDIDGRRYPAALAGDMYPKGIPIHADENLADLIRDNAVDLVAFSYSDVPHSEVMHKASIVNACGADFILIGAQYTMIESTKPVISVCAVRTGCGKSQTSRELIRILHNNGQKSGRGPASHALRRLDPAGRPALLVVQDFDRHNCTIEEREEYEPVVRMGSVVYAGIDYEKILRQAETEADVIIWDGGNNDTPFYKPTVHLVVFDPHRPGHELSYHPGETNMLMADIAIINKVDSADPQNVEIVRQNISSRNPGAEIVLAESEVTAEDPDAILGRRVLVVEDGPTLTHGEMQYGAGVIAARRNGAAELVDPRPYLAGSIQRTFEKYPGIGPVLPAMGYSRVQIEDLEATINRTDCDLVVLATPVDLTALVDIDKPTVRVRYEYKDHSRPTLEDLIRSRLEQTRP